MLGPSVTRAGTTAGPTPVGAKPAATELPGVTPGTPFPPTVRMPVASLGVSSRVFARSAGAGTEVSSEVNGDDSSSTAPSELGNRSTAGWGVVVSAWGAVSALSPRTI